MPRGILFHRVAPLVLVSAAVLAAMTDLQVSAQQAPPAAPRTPRAAAPVDLTGNWVSVVTEEWLWRMTTPKKGDYTSIPISDEGRESQIRGTRRLMARARPTAREG
jgi:hypothetical protein